MFLGPISGLIFGGFLHGSKTATRIMGLICLVVNFPFYVWFFTRYQTSLFIPIIGIMLFNVALIIIPFIIFKRIFNTDPAIKKTKNHC